MGIKTSIEWCDSSLNLMAGCDGCELWNANSKHCYAGQLTERYKGQAGWPESFDNPKLFTERIVKVLKWSDLTGKDRPDKPWLNGMPRMVFLNDMGDTFTESLPLDWLAPLLPMMEESPHVFMLLTKRASRMAEFSYSYPLPKNVWPGVSVTSMNNLQRVNSLLKVYGGGMKWVSVEPLLGPVSFDQSSLIQDGETTGWNMFGSPENGISWVVVGGESGPGARPCNVEWIRSIAAQCKAAQVKVFVKQLGSNAFLSDDFGSCPLQLKDKKGGEPTEWPEDLHIREMPN